MSEAPRRRSAARRGIDRFRFAIERWVMRGLHYRLLIAAVIVAVVALLSGALAAFLDAGGNELGENIWWAFLRLTDPGYLGDDEGLARRTISTIVTVLGYLLFLGLLVAILIQWLNQLISHLESGVTGVALSDHVVILGWTHRTPTIVAELLRTGPRVERFLARRGASALRIAILADRVDHERLRELRDRLGPLWNDRKVYLRAGTPLRMDHLERVAFRDAAALILPGADFGEVHPESVDAQTVKTLLAVSENASAAGAVPPLAVVELFEHKWSRIAREAYAGDSEILAADDIVSRIIAQSVRQRGLRRVFAELLTLDAGSALFVRSGDALVGKAFAELRAAHPRAILLGTVRSGAGQPSLNPHPDARLEAGDLLVFIARSYEDCSPAAEPGPPLPAATEPPPPTPPSARRVLILGWSRKAPVLLEELDAAGAGDLEVDVVSVTPLDVREEALARHGTELPGARVRQILAGYTGAGVLEGLDPHSYDHVVMLASERMDGEEAADATTVFGYRMLHSLLRDDSTAPRIFVELLDDESEFLFRRDPADELVSPTLVSYVLSQVALRRELAAVIAELSRSSGAQITLRAAPDYLGTSESVTFADLDHAAARHGEIALGVHGPGANGELELNPDRGRRWTLGPADDVVVLATPHDGADDR